MHDLKGHAHTAVIGDVFTDDELAVYLAAVEGNAVKLIDHFLGQSLEGGIILFLPPVFQVAVFIKTCTVVVEGVGDFMADDRADAAQVFFDALGKAVKGLLQNRSRESDVVRVRVVARVDHMARHQPFRAVNRL